jgi:Fe-S cluster assembly protein SufD
LARAIETGDLAELPSRRDEDWHWTDLRGLIREAPPASPPGDVGRLGHGPWAGANERVFLNGRPLNGREIVVRPGDQPLALRFVSQADGGGHDANVEITVEPGAKLTLLESYEGAASGYVASTRLNIRLGAGAWAERFVLTADAADAVSVSIAEVGLDRDCDFSQTVLAGGCRRQRLETHVAHPGADSSIRLDSVYLLGDQRHADITTVVDHKGPFGITEQLTKGVVAGQGRGVFQGRITVEPGADKTDARMEHHALVLSDRAEVDAKPELEIFADEVACSHGNTVGALDEDALFYAMQRGVPEPEARAMLTEAFVGEVIERIRDERARAIAHAWASERLRALS